jgi:hypothetical protein
MLSRSLAVLVAASWIGGTAWAQHLAALVDRAISAAGGAQALGALKTVSMSGVTKH